MGPAPIPESVGAPEESRMPVSSVKEVFERHMPAKLQSKPDVVAKINAIYQFNISGPDGGNWSVDCTQPGGRIAARAGEIPPMIVR